MREKRVGLKYRVDVPLVGRDAAHVPVAEVDLALSRRLEAADHLQRRGLPAAGGPEQAEELTVVDIQRQIVDGDGVSEHLDHVPQSHICGSGPLLAFLQCSLPHRRQHRAEPNAASSLADAPPGTTCEVVGWTFGHMQGPLDVGGQRTTDGTVSLSDRRTYARSPRSGSATPRSRRGRGGAGTPSSSRTGRPARSARR